MTVGAAVRSFAGRADQAAMFVAASDAPLTFQRTLMPRSTLDQGVVTGLAVAFNYAFTALVQDTLEAVTRRASRTPPATGEADSPWWRRLTAGLNLATVGAGLAVQSVFRQRPDERLERATARTVGYWLARGASAGLAVAVVQEALHLLDRKAEGDREYRWLPLGVPASGLLSGLTAWREHQRRVAVIAAAGGGHLDDEWHVSVGRAVAISAGVSFGVTALSATERALASTVGQALATVLPGEEREWRPVGHAAALTGLVGGVAGLLRDVEHRIEAGASRLEPAFDTPPASALVSGAPGSAVPFDTLSKQGRRNVATALQAAWIKEVIGEEAMDPIRVFVGLDSAPDETGRVALAIADLERTAAFDRDLLMVISPTGTGYVNYVAVESAEYLTRGNMGSVTIQYSLRPSVMSLDRTWEGRRHYRMLVEAIHNKVQERAARRQQRPRVVAFGESLGAWTSQDAFIHQGTRGLQDLGINRALWIGTPYESKWKTEVLHGGAPDVDRSLVGVFDHFGQVEGMNPEARAKLRYVMITHANDAVASFGLDLLVQSPPWLGDPRTRPPTVPVGERWTTPTTFLQTLVDMKNSANVIPGQFEAKGHDYRADLARFIREVYALPANEEQMKRIETALRRAELARKKWIDEHDAART